MRGPWHLWVVGAVSLLWNAGGGYDYIMTKTGNEAYLAMLNEAQRAFIDTAPLWFHAGWAVGVWGSVLGSFLLLLRSRIASFAFGLSFVGMITSWSYALFVARPSAFEINGLNGFLFSLGILAIILILWAYSRAMTRRGHLS